MLPRIPSASRRRRKTASAFTLIELLSAVVIVSVLIGIILPVVNGIRERARAAHCTSNFRQMGVALLLYVGDNDGMLPGPMNAGQGMGYRIDSDGKPVATGGLAGFLVPYMNEPNRGEGTWTSQMFLCHGWVRQRDSDGPNTPSQAYQADQNYLGRAGDTGWQPRLYSVVPSPSQTWAFRETDKEASYAGKGNDNGGRLISRPAHGSFRNNLYFDGHVSARPLSDD